MKILFLGTHGQKNWGDELMLRVFLDRLDGKATKFYVNSYEPKVTAGYLNKPNVTVFDTKHGKLKLVGYLLTCDALVFGGGNILKELYTAYGGSQYATLGMIDKLTRTAATLRKPIYLCNVGVGPLDTSHGRQMAAGIVKRATMTTVRDSRSFKLLKSLHVDSPFERTSDAVFSTDRTYFGLSQRRKKRTIKDVSSLQKVSISLCRNIKNNDNWAYFIDNLAADLLKLYKQNPAISFSGIPMQSGVSSNDDVAALKELKAKLLKKAPAIAFEILKPSSPEELARAIDTSDVFVGERLHGLILSTVLGVPIVALEYDIKVTGVVNDLCPDIFGIDINGPFKKGSIYKAIKAIADDYPQATEDIRQAYKTAHAESARSFRTLTESLKGDG